LPRGLEKQLVDDEKSLISDSDKQRLEQLKEKMASSPKDRAATRKELRKIANKYQKKIEAALKDQDFDLAEDYVLEILEITPKRSKAYKELTDSLGKIRARKYEINNQ